MEIDLPVNEVCGHKNVGHLSFGHKFTYLGNGNMHKVTDPRRNEKEMDKMLLP